VTALDELSSSDTIERPVISRRRKLLVYAVGRSAHAWLLVKEWNVRAVPGLAGAGLIAAAAAIRFGIWAGLAVGGVFLLRIDSRIR